MFKGAGVGCSLGSCSFMDLKVLLPSERCGSEINGEGAYGGHERGKPSGLSKVPCERKDRRAQLFF